MHINKPLISTSLFLYICSTQSAWSAFKTHFLFDLTSCFTMQAEMTINLKSIILILCRRITPDLKGPWKHVPLPHGVRQTTVHSYMGIPGRHVHIWTLQIHVIVSVWAIIRMIWWIKLGNYQVSCIWDLATIQENWGRGDRLIRQRCLNRLPSKIGVILRMGEVTRCCHIKSQYEE